MSTEGGNRRPVVEEVVQEIEAAAREVAGEPGLERIRRATRRLAATDVDPDDPRAALAVVEHHVEIDVEVPTASRRRGVSLVKRAVKRAIGWYLRYVGHQVTLLGQSVVGLGTALVDRTETLDHAVEAARHDLDALSARVSRLEALAADQAERQRP